MQRGPAALRGAGVVQGHRPGTGHRLAHGQRGRPATAEDHSGGGGQHERPAGPAHGGVSAVAQPYGPPAREGAAPLRAPEAHAVARGSYSSKAGIGIGVGIGTCTGGCIVMRFRPLPCSSTGQPRTYLAGHQIRLDPDISCTTNPLNMG